ncbi:MAG: hypothetical protein QXE31_00355 [Candidatus Woesearchaeota archaeon]
MKFIIKLLKKFFFVIILLIALVGVGFPKQSQNNYFINYKYLSFEDINKNFFIDKEIEVPLVAVVNQISDDNIEDTLTQNIILGSLKIYLLKTKNNETKNNNQKHINHYKIFIDDKIKLNETTIKSIFDSVNYIEKKLKIENQYFISYNLNSKSLSGTSSGASIALGIFLLNHNKKPNLNFIISGSIDDEGNLLPSGSIYYKSIFIDKHNQKISEKNYVEKYSIKNNFYNILYVSKGQSKTLLKLDNNMYKEISINNLTKTLKVVELNNIDEILNKIDYLE